jgi:hypothetical protein
MGIQKLRSKLGIVLRLAGSGLLLGAIVACGGSDDDSNTSTNTGNTGTTNTNPTAQEEAAEGPMDLALPALNLHVSVPQGSSVSEMLGMQMVTGSGVTFSVKAATDSDPATLEAARSEASMFTPVNIAEETLSDGWVLTYENTGGMGTNYFATVRRDIGGTAYMCSATVMEAAQRQAAVDACKSLRR